MKIRILNTVLASSILFTSNLVTAAIVDTDNDSFIDTNTGLEWMDFGVNSGQSFNYVVSQLGLGGEYEGWSLPDADQVYQMWSGAFLGQGAQLELPDHYGPGEFYVADWATDVASVFDETYEIMGYNFLQYAGATNEFEISKGWFESDGGSLSYVRTRNYTFDDPYNVDDSIFNDIMSMDADYKATATAEVSTMLVRTVSVSEPSTLAIFSLAVIGLASRKLRKKR